MCGMEVLQDCTRISGRMAGHNTPAPMTATATSDIAALRKESRAISSSMLPAASCFAAHLRGVCQELVLLPLHKLGGLVRRRPNHVRVAVAQGQCADACGKHAWRVGLCRSRRQCSYCQEEIPSGAKSAPTDACACKSNDDHQAADHLYVLQSIVRGGKPHRIRSRGPFCLPPSTPKTPIRAPQ